MPSSNRYTHIYTPQPYFFTLIPHSHPCQPPPTTPLTSIHLTHVPVRGRGRLRNLQDIARSLHVTNGRGGRRGWKREGIWRWRKKNEKNDARRYRRLVHIYTYHRLLSTYLPANLTYRLPPIHSGGGGDGEIQLPPRRSLLRRRNRTGDCSSAKEGHTKITKNKKARMRFLIIPLPLSSALLYRRVCVYAYDRRVMCSFRSLFLYL